MTTMKMQMGDRWYGRQGTAYEEIEATIDYITSRYVQVSFTPTLHLNGSPRTWETIRKTPLPSELHPTTTPPPANYF